MRIVILLIGMVLTTLVCSCVSYQPKPLPTGLTAPARGQIQHIDFTRPLTPQQLAAITVLLNPDLQALRRKAGVAQAQVFAAGLLPDPQISLAYDQLLHPGPGLSEAYSAGISWDISGLITRRLKIKTAEMQYQQIRYDIAWQEWLFANQAEILATRVYFLQQQLDLSNQAMQSVQELLSTTRRNLQRHDIKIDEFGLRQAAYLDLQDQIGSLRRTLEKSRQQLNQILGLAPGEKISLTIKPVEIPAHLDAESLFTQAQSNRLDWLALQAGYASQELQLRQAVLGQFPGFTIGIVQAQDTTHVQTLGPTLSFNLPLFNRNRGAIAIANATREQLYYEYLARLRQTRADLAAVVADLQRIQYQINGLQRGLPDLKKSEQLMRIGLNGGNVSLISYQNVLATLLNKETKLLALQQEADEQLLALQLSCGKLRCWEANTHAH